MLSETCNVSGQPAIDMSPKAVRQRLRHPPNAKHDPGISLRRVHGLTGYAAERRREEERAARQEAERQRRLDAGVTAMRLAQEAIERRRRFTFIETGELERDNEPPRPISINRIQHLVADAYGTPQIDMVSARRTANVVRPRQVAMYLAKTVTLRSLPEIGRRFGGRDHTTVLHAVRKIEGLIKIDADLAARVANFKRILAPPEPVDVGVLPWPFLPAHDPNQLELPGMARTPDSGR